MHLPTHTHSQKININVIEIKTKKSVLLAFSLLFSFSLSFPFETRSYLITQAGLDLVMLLFLLPECEAMLALVSSVFTPLTTALPLFFIHVDYFVS